MSLSSVKKMSGSLFRTGKIALSAAVISAYLAVRFGDGRKIALDGELNIYSYR